MANNATVKEHPLARILRAIADGIPIQGKWDEEAEWWDFNPKEHAFSIRYPALKWRIEPKEVVDYTIVFKGGCPGSNFFPSVEEVNERYTCWSQSEGYLKRTTVDGKVVKMEFIPK